MSEAAFDAKRRKVLDLLGLDPHDPTVTGGISDLCALLPAWSFSTMPKCSRVLGVVMGETLDVGNNLIEWLGSHLKLDMARAWRAGVMLLAGIRDKEVMGRLLANVVGEKVATETIPMPAVRTRSSPGSRRPLWFHPLDARRWRGCRRSVSRAPACR